MTISVAVARQQSFGSGRNGVSGANRSQSASQYAANRVEPGHSASHGYDISMPVGSEGTNVAANSPAVASIPADFDVAGFVRNAKMHYIRLQAAHDAGNLDDIREFTTPEMFAEIKLTLTERACQAQVTDVLGIEAEVIDVAEEGNRYVVSTRFTGKIQEDGGHAESIDEIWHLVKTRNGHAIATAAGCWRAFSKSNRRIGSSAPAYPRHASEPLPLVGAACLTRTCLKDVR